MISFISDKNFFFIDVIDDRKKILLLFSHPHPDVAAIKESLESHDQYEVHSHWVSDFNKENLNFYKHHDYSLIISHQLSSEEKLEYLARYDTKPIWYIIGSNSDLNIFNQKQNFIKFKNTNNSFEFANVSLNRNFSSFLIK